MRAPTWASSAVEIFSDAVELMLPVTCAGCGSGHRTICRRCRSHFTAVRRCEEDTVVLGAQEYAPSLGLPTWTLAGYAGPVRHIVLAWKSGARPDLARVIEQLGMKAGRHLAAELDLPAPTGSTDLPAPTGSTDLPLDLLVVPAPSGWRRRMARRLVAADLARALAQGVAEATGARVWAVDVLRRTGPSTHRLGAAARARRGRGAVRVVCTLPPGVPVLIVDDVVTTGATIQASRQALEHAGAAVIGAFALAATPPPGRPPGPRLSATC